MQTGTCYSLLMKTERRRVPIDAARRDHLERTASARGVSAASLVRATIDEVLRDFAHVRAPRRERQDAAALTAEFATLLPPQLSPDTDTLAQGSRVFHERTRGGASDAAPTLVAMRREHLAGRLSADRTFTGIPGLRHLDPGADRFSDEIGAAG